MNIENCAIETNEKKVSEGTCDEEQLSLSGKVVDTKVSESTCNEEKLTPSGKTVDGFVEVQMKRRRKMKFVPNLNPKKVRNQVKKCN